MGKDLTEESPSGNPSPPAGVVGQPGDGTSMNGYDYRIIMLQ